MYHDRSRYDWFGGDWGYTNSVTVAPDGWAWWSLGGLSPHWGWGGRDDTRYHTDRLYTTKFIDAVWKNILLPTVVTP